MTTTVLTSELLFLKPLTQPNLDPDPLFFRVFLWIIQLLSNIETTGNIWMLHPCYIIQIIKAGAVHEVTGILETCLNPISEVIE